MTVLIQPTTTDVEALARLVYAEAANIEEFGGPVAFVLSWLDEAAAFIILKS